MPHLSWLEWFGYAASVVVAISLMMSSIVKLRWYNLAGALGFATYGLLIKAYPVAVLNAFIACADVYYLVKLYSERERFQLVRISPGSEYLHRFLETCRPELARFFPGFDFTMKDARVGFYVLRNLVPAGIFIGSPRPGGVLAVDVDYVLPAYRDFKAGAFLFAENRELFRQMGFQRLEARSHDRTHDTYLRRMGFEAVGQEGGHTLYAWQVG